MEPCLFRHGKVPTNVAIPLLATVASMEPCLFRHGKDAEVAGSSPTNAASMEPCLFRHGKIIPNLICIHMPTASMEPCLFRHGKPYKETNTHSKKGSFNGAMSFQTW